MRGAGVVLVAALAAAAAAAGVARGQTAAQGLFEADVEIYNDPTILGSVTGHMWYNYQGGVGKQRIDYDVGNPPAYSVVKEHIDYNTDIRSLFCTACEASTYRKAMPKYFLVAADTQDAIVRGLPNSIQVGSRTCTGKAKAGVTEQGEVIVVYQDAQNRVCRAVFDDETTTSLYTPGRYVDFLTAPAPVASNNPAFAENAQWNCPQPVCAVKIDLVVVLDESGSVSSTSFTQEKNFVISIFNSYTIAADVVQGGAVAFASSARQISALTGIRSNLMNALNALTQRGGATCIPCGLEIATNQLQGSSRNVGQVVITLTDGQNNRRTSELQTFINLMQSRGIISFGIGVGGSFNVNQVRALAYNINSRYFDVAGGFSGLNAILGQLIQETCTDLPGNPCGAGCRGFCACGQTCLCPTACKSASVCLSGVCTPGTNGNGCQFVSNSCDDNNGCTIDSCDPVTGCEYQNRTCTSPDPCRIASCNPALTLGCTDSANTCFDGNPCTSDICTPGVGCQYAAIPCDQCNLPVFNGTACADQDTACTTYRCIGNNASCTAIPRDCDDGNACSVDTCDPVTGCVNTNVVCDDGNACTLDPCDPITGCFVGGPVNCDDNNNCTIDTCDPVTGCIHTPVDCSDGDICTTDTCNSVTGCISRERDCSIEPDIAKFASDCQLALCSIARSGCYLQQINGTLIDDCGVCNGDNSTCEQLGTSEVVGIGVAGIIFIVLGAVALCAAIAFIGGKKGYDIYQRNQGGMFGADTSPMYNSGNLAGESALYDGQ